MRKFHYTYLTVGVCLLLSFISLPLFVSTNSNNSFCKDYDTIIVLGGGLSRHCTLDDSMKERMETAIQFYRENEAKIILTGGPQQKGGNCLESESMRQYALSQKVLDVDVFKESQALNTYQNAHYAVQLMQEKGLKHALIITSDFHVKRANLIFEKYDIEYSMIASTNKAKGGEYCKQLLKEQLLLCFHQVFGIPDRFGLDVKDKKLYAVLKSLATS